MLVLVVFVWSWSEFSTSSRLFVLVRLNLSLLSTPGNKAASTSSVMTDWRSDSLEHKAACQVENASGSKVRTIMWVSNYWWMTSQHACPSGQRRTAGLNVSIKINWSENLHVSLIIWENTTHTLLSAFSAVSVALTVACCDLFAPVNAQLR